VGLTVRVAEDADVTTLAAVRRAWNEGNAGVAIDDSAEFEATFAKWWAAERSTRTFFIVEVAGVPVGMANVKRYDRMPVAGRANGGWWGYVGNVFVLEAHRNAGVGKFLMDQIVAWAGPAGMEHLRLAPSPLAKSFYSRLGFVPGAVVELDPPNK
jgi:GNAT superfamily N-acetyltransferase